MSSNMMLIRRYCAACKADKKEWSWDKAYCRKCSRYDNRLSKIDKRNLNINKYFKLHGKHYQKNT